MKIKLTDTDIMSIRIAFMRDRSPEQRKAKVHKHKVIIHRARIQRLYEKNNMDY